MASPDLMRLFAALPLPTGDSAAGRFSAQPIPGIRSCSVGKDAVGSPVLLIETEAAGPRGAVAPILLEHLSVLHNVDCRMQDAGGGTSTHRLSVIRFCSGDPTLHEYFLRSLTPVIASLPARPTREQVGQLVSQLIELFRQATQAPRKTVQGLWAELFIISCARDPSCLLRYWHTDPADRFDFAQHFQRLEVKAAAGRVRAHHFAYEQLRPPRGTRAMIASVLVERSTGGPSIADLIDEIRAHVVDPDLLVRMDLVVAETLGSEWRASHEYRFDQQLAAESLRFLDAQTIPCVRDDLPPEISDLHFRVDLTDHPLRVCEELQEEGGLFWAVFPD